MDSKAKGIDMEANDLILKTPVRNAEKMRHRGPINVKDAFTAEEVATLMQELPRDRIPVAEGSSPFQKRPTCTDFFETHLNRRYNHFIAFHFYSGTSSGTIIAAEAKISAPQNSDRFQGQKRVLNAKKT